MQKRMFYGKNGDERINNVTSVEGNEVIKERLSMVKKGVYEALGK